MSLSRGRLRPVEPVAWAQSCADPDDQNALDSRAIPHLVAEHAVVNLLAQARPFRDVAPELLRTIGEAGEWHAGALWRADAPRHALRCVEFWCARGAAVGEFDAATRASHFARGEGLPGRVSAAGEPAWIDDVAVDRHFSRAPVARRVGLHSAVASPFRVRGDVAGVLEYFAREVRQPDAACLQLLDVVCTHIGHFIELRETDEMRDRLAAIVDSSDDAIVSKTLEGVITSWNPGAEHIFGYTAAEAIGQPIYLIVPPDRRAEEQQVLARLRRGEKIHHFETERLAKDGRRLNISLTVSPIRDAEGRIVGASKVARDISERKRAEEQLRLSEERAQAQVAVTTMLNRVGSTVASSLDRDDIVQTVTDLATEVTTAEVGAFFYNVLDPESGESYQRCTLSGASKEAFATFQPRAAALFAPTFRGESTIRLDDMTADPRYGRNAPYHGLPAGLLPVRSYLATPVKGRSGEILGGLCFGHSRPGVFTAHHAQVVDGIAVWASIALENARLYATSEEALREVEAARRTAEAANRAKDEFLAMLGHELRNPLAPIFTALQLMHIRDDGAARERAVIDRQVRHLAKAGRRPARRLADRAGQDQDQQGDRPAGGRGRARGRDGEPAVRGAAASAPCVRSRRGPPRERRPRAARPGGDEPADERRQVHAGRRPHRHPGRAGRRKRRAVGERQRGRNLTDAASPRIRAVHSGSAGAGSIAGRPGTRPDDRAQPGAASRRDRRGPQRGLRARERIRDPAARAAGATPGVARAPVAAAARRGAAAEGAGGRR